MGASFRSQQEIEQLAGCDRLTIAPSLLEKLEQDQGLLERKLAFDKSQQDDTQPSEKITMDEKKFRLMLNEDAMATEKLAEGIRNFSYDLVKLEKLIQERW